MKKRILFEFTGILLIIIIIGLGAFALGGSSEEITTTDINLIGAWKVVSYVAADTAILNDSEFLVFDEKTAHNYKTDTSTPYVSSLYSFEGKTISLSDISKQYTIQNVTDNIIRFYESPTVYMVLIRHPNIGLQPANYDTSTINGAWDVIHRPGLETVSCEYLEFDHGMLYDYRNGIDTPALTSAYNWDASGNIVIEELDLAMSVYMISEEVICCVEKDTGYIWELHRRVQ